MPDLSAISRGPLWFQNLRHAFEWVDTVYGPAIVCRLCGEPLRFPPHVGPEDVLPALQSHLSAPPVRRDT